MSTCFSDRSSAAILTCSSMPPCYYYNPAMRAHLPMQSQDQLLLEETLHAMSQEAVRLNSELASLCTQMALLKTRIAQLSATPPSASPIITKCGTKIRNKKVDKSSTPENGKLDQGQQTSSKETSDQSQQTETLITKLKNSNRKILEELLPALREPLRLCTDAMTEMALYVDTLLAEQNADVRPPLQDAIVLSLIEVYGCQNRRAFDEKLKELFLEDFEEWRPRLHNSLFHTIRMNKISCFGRRNRKRKPKQGKSETDVIPDED